MVSSRLFNVVAGLALAACAGCGEPPQNVLKGKVTYDQAPLPNVLVVVNGAKNQHQGGSSDDNGNYQVINPPLGAVKIQVIEPPERLVKGKQKPGLQKLAQPGGGIPYDMQPGVQVKDLEITSPLEK